MAKVTYVRGSLLINQGRYRTPVVCDLLEDIYKNPGVSLSDLARKHGITAGRLYHLMKEKSGVVKVGKWQHFQRMLYAAELLFYAGLSPVVVADYCGYVGVQSFSRAFKDFWGKAPRPWQKWAREVKDPNMVFAFPEEKIVYLMTGDECNPFFIYRLEYIPSGCGSS